MSNTHEVVESRVKNFKLVLANQYQKQIENYFGDQKKAMKFLSAVVSAVQRTPKLLDCEPTTLINSFMTMAQLEFMPSDVSGEAYVLPYNDKTKGMIAQFQLGYQGLVTLFYRAGVRAIVAEIVYKNDAFSYINGELTHSPDIFSDNRGDAIGAYVIVELQHGGKITKVMSKKQIMDIGQKFSKSFSTSFTPWKVANDPDLWMWKKTVLKQAAKLVPKNETIFKAIAEDNKDSNISERMQKAKTESEGLKMGAALLKSGEDEPVDYDGDYLIEESEKEPGVFNIYDENGERVQGGLNKEMAEKWVESKKKRV